MFLLLGGITGKKKETMRHKTTYCYEKGIGKLLGLKPDVVVDKIDRSGCKDSDYCIKYHCLNAI